LHSSPQGSREERGKATNLRPSEPSFSAFPSGAYAIS
jgi:hypothetical protein